MEFKSTPKPARNADAISGCASIDFPGYRCNLRRFEGVIFLPNFNRCCVGLESFSTYFHPPFFRAICNLGLS
jgi:hypothetical protein